MRFITIQKLALLMLLALSASVFAGLGSSNAQAQSTFAGLYGQTSTGYEGNKLTNIIGNSVEIPSDGYNVESDAPSQNFGGAPLLLGLGYYWQPHSSWLLGIGADYSAISQTSSNWQSNVTNAPGNNLIPAGTSMTANGSNLQLSNRYNFFISPGYAIDKNKLVYLKVGYSQVMAQEGHATSVTVSGNGTSVTVPTTTAGTSTNLMVGGYIIGVGYKQIITDGLYGFVEGNYMGYSKLGDTYSAKGNSASKEAEGVSNSSVTNITGSQRLNTYQLLIGVGYVF
jgi:hypothetical protein